MASAGLAHVYTPDLRGHGRAPARRGDVNYLGQLEDDLDDFLARLRLEHPDAALLLGGHSSGGGLVIRHAGGRPEIKADGYLLLAPYLHHKAPTHRSDAGWARPNVPRLIGLSLLNRVGITAFNDRPVIRFNMPRAVRDGTETLTYSYRLQVSLHPATTTPPIWRRSTRPPWCWWGKTTRASGRMPIRRCSRTPPRRRRCACYRTWAIWTWWRPRRPWPP
ncbi:alpha/beta fold hydrolase [Alcanivorax sp. IO_7]|nr:alpha/beta fold hydrolase [Alcanivorax sp. IO_7]